MEPRIGVISPYEDFTALVYRLAAEMELPVKVEQAVLANGVAIARRWESEGIQVVVGRGPTAVMMRRVLRIPVVMINITAFDVMEALYRARQVGEKIAFTDYDLKRRPYDLDQLGRMLGISFEPLLYKDVPDLRARISAAARAGFDVVVGTGSCVPRMVEEKGMRAILVHSSREAVSDALRQARELVDLAARESARSQMSQAVQDLTVNGIITLEADGRIGIFNRSAERFFGLKAGDVLGKRPEEAGPVIARVIGDGKETLSDVVNIGGSAYAVARMPIKVGSEQRGLVVIVHAGSQIQQWEAKIRKELSDKGLVARYTFDDIGGSAPILKETVERAKQYARSDLTVLVTGESGTGKELFAQSMHRASPRSDGPFVAINCAALPENLLESELFGYEDGAFTGARKGGAQGLFETAHGGTLFLDEIGEMPLNLQSRLLRALQERRVRRVGGSRVIPVDVRVIAATNRDLGRMVREGKFREDLFYRLNVLNLSLPPLRQRMEDLPELATLFLARLGYPPMPAEAAQMLRSYSWPGNVRELENFLQKYAVLSEGARDSRQLVGSLLQEMKRQTSETKPPGLGGEETLTIAVGTMDAMEREILTRLDAAMGHDRTRLARRLGISRTTLWKKLKEAELTSEF